MAHLWKSGDLARCINADPCPIFPSSVRRVKGRVYRVVDVMTINDVYGRSQVGLKLDRDNPIHPVTGGEAYSNAICFRPIKPASRKFTEAMRSLKPRVEA